jgi:hypothetical protein
MEYKGLERINIYTDSGAQYLQDAWCITKDFWSDAEPVD